MTTGSQIRAARALLGWETADLAKRAGLARSTISEIENGVRQGREGSLEKIVRVFEEQGRVEFTENEGVRRKASNIEIYEGPARFEEFTEFVYEYLKRKGGEVCVSVTNERLFQQHRRNLELHRTRMKELVASGKVEGRILAADGDFKETWAKIRRQSSGTDAPVSFYAFGDCLALISFDHEPAPYVVLHKSGPFAAAYRQAFNASWDKAKAP